MAIDRFPTGRRPYHNPADAVAIVERDADDLTLHLRSADSSTSSDWSRIVSLSQSSSNNSSDAHARAHSHWRPALPHSFRQPARSSWSAGEDVEAMEQSSRSCNSSNSISGASQQTRRANRLFVKALRLSSSSAGGGSPHRPRALSLPCLDAEMSILLLRVRRPPLDDEIRGIGAWAS